MADSPTDNFPEDRSPTERPSERPDGDGGRRESGRDDRPRGDWSRDDRPRRDGDRKWEDRPRRDYGDRQRDNRSRDDRPRRDYGDRPRGDWSKDDRRGGSRQNWSSDRRDDRPRRDGDRRWEDRPRRDYGDRQRSEASRSEWRRDDDTYRSESVPPRPGLEPRADEPETPQDLDLRELPRAVRAELRGLSLDMAQVVGAHLLMAGQLLDTDPELAYLHAEAARRRAARLSVCREAAGESAYAAGKYAIALNEFRALRRMMGGTDYIAAMADCERALGRPQQALKLISEGFEAGADFAQRVELRLVEAGVRLEMGQPEEALRILRTEIESAAGRGSRESRTRLRYGYADMLERTGNAEEAERWFAAAAALDTEGLTDATDRIERLQGVVLEIVEEDLVGYPGEEVDEPDAEDSEEDETEDVPDTEDEFTEPSYEADELEERADELDELDEPDEPKVFVEGYDVVFFDLDGVIYLGPTVVSGALAGVAGLREAGIRTIFVTNNAARSASDVAEHLVELGFDATADDVVTSAQAASSLLRRDLEPGSRVLVAGTANLVEQVEAAGMVAVARADENPDAVIQGYDPEMTWPRLDQAAFAVQRGAKWYACNTDSTRPTEEGLVPGAGVAVMAVRNTVDFDPIVAGKPFPPLLEEARRRTEPQRPVFVGDRIDTDIQGATAVGMDSFLVFTGAHGKSDLLAAPVDGRPTAIGWDVPALLADVRTARASGKRAVCRGVVARAKGGVVELSGDISDQETQLDALWAVAQLVWANPKLDSADVVASLDLIP